MKGNELILVGAGGHALSLAEFAAGEIRGYLAMEENPEMTGEWLGTDDMLESLIAEGHLFHIAFVYSELPHMESRRELIETYESKGAKFKTLVSPLATVTPNSKIGEGCAVMTGSIINRATLGRNVIVNSGAIVEHDCRVGDNTFIGPGAVIGGFTTIGSGCFIGLGARIGNGLKIGDNITVAMGAVVSKDLEEPGLYHGNPLKIFKWKK